MEIKASHKVTERGGEFAITVQGVRHSHTQRIGHDGTRADYKRAERDAFIMANAFAELMNMLRNEAPSPSSHNACIDIQNAEIEMDFED